MNAAQQNIHVMMWCETRSIHRYFTKWLSDFTDMSASVIQGSAIGRCRLRMSSTLVTYDQLRMETTYWNTLMTLPHRSCRELDFMSSWTEQHQTVGHRQ